MNSLLKPEHKKIDFWYGLLISAFCFSLPFEGVARAVPNIILIPLAILFPFTIKRKSFNNWYWLPIILYAILWLSLLAKALVFGQFEMEMGFLTKLFLVSAIFLLMTPIDSIPWVKKGLVYGTTAAILLSFGAVIGYIIESGHFKFSSGPQVNSVLVTERVYLAFLAVISSIFCFDEITKEVNRTPKKRLYLAILLLNVFLILMVAARMATISLVAIGVFYFLFKKRYKQLLYFGAAAVALLFVSIIANPNLKNRIFYADKKKSFVEKVKAWEPRVVIWGCTFSSLSDADFNYFYGFASSNEVQGKLLTCYDKNIEREGKRYYFLREKFNPHNQYFDIMLLTGFLGLLLFAGVFLYLIKYNRHSFANLALTISFLLLGLVECYLHRQLGVYLFGIVCVVALKKEELLG